jgi:hypothetical protein
MKIEIGAETGVTDSHGKPLYVGDVVTYFADEEHTAKATIVYSTCQMMLDFGNGDTCDLLSLLSKIIKN